MGVGGVVVEGEEGCESRLTRPSLVKVKQTM